MADESKDNPQETPDEPSRKGSKGSLKLMGGVVGVIALGAMAAFMAMPKKEEQPQFTGPYSYNVISEDEKISANTTDNDNKRYLQLVVHCEYYAYKKSYLDTRVTDDLYKPILYSEITRLIASKRLAETIVGTAREAFEAELQALLDPILFPVHIGDSKLPHDACPRSGVRPGLSYRKTGFRGRFHDHVLKIDAPAGTLQIDDGPLTRFEGGEEDLAVPSPDGALVYLDLTQLKPDFQGEVEIGIRGRIRRLNLPHMIAQ